MWSRAPRHPALRNVVQTIWASKPGAAPAHTERERVLPTGALHLVFRLNGEPLRLYADRTDQIGSTVATAIVGGVRETAWIRDVSRPVVSVGVQLAPGAAPALLGVPVDALGGRHLDLELLWGSSATEIQERLAHTPPEARLDLFERLLAERIQPTRTLHPGIAAAIGLFEGSTEVRAAVEASGLSHRHFIRRFREATGFLPSDFARLRRLQRALRLRATAPRQGWADVAVAAGYSDQAHWGRELRRIAGMTPGSYERLASAPSLHVPLGAEVKIVQDGGRPRQ